MSLTNMRVSVISKPGGRPVYSDTVDPKTTLEELASKVAAAGLTFSASHLSADIP